jgi:hypothetical protein
MESISRVRMYVVVNCDEASKAGEALKRNLWAVTPESGVSSLCFASRSVSLRSPVMAEYI